MSEPQWTHPNALVESHSIGGGTRVWAFSHIMQGVVVGRHCNIGEHVFIEEGALIGDRVTIKNGVQIWRGITIEDDVFVGPNAAFTNDRYPRSPRSEAARHRYESDGWLSPTRLHQGVSIGAGATILCGLEIGPYAMVAAGALVSKPVPTFALAVGVPAEVVGYVCMCGQPLGKERTRPRCLSCGRQYSRNADSLELLAQPFPMSEMIQDTSN